MSNTLESVHLLEDKLKGLLSNYEFLKNENESLLEVNSELYSLLHENQKKLNSLQEAYNLLKIAKTIQGSNEDVRNTKLKVNALIREIDKCIVLLNS